MAAAYAKRPRRDPEKGFSHARASDYDAPRGEHLRRGRRGLGVRRRDHRLPAGGAGLAGVRARAGAALRPGRLSRPARAGAVRLLAQPSSTRAGCSTCGIMRDLAVLTARRRGGRIARVRQRPAARARRRVRRPALAARRSPAPSSTPTTTAPRRRSSPARRPPSPRWPRSAPSTRWPGRAGREADATAPGGALRRGPPPSVQRRLPAGLPEPRPLRHRLPGDGEEHRRHHLHRAGRGARSGGLPAARGACASTRRARAGGNWRVGFRDLQYRIERRGGGARCSCWPPARSARRACCSRTRRRLGQPLAGARPPLLGQRRRAGARDRPARPGVAGARTEFGPSDDEPDRLHRRARVHGRRRRAARQASAACWQIVRGVNALTGLGPRRAARQERGDQARPHRPPGDPPQRESSRGSAPIGDFAGVPDDRARRRRRADAPHAPVSLLRHPLEQGGQRRSCSTACARPRASSPTRPAGHVASSRSTPARWASSSPSTRSAGCPMSDDPGARGRRRRGQGPRLRRAVRARRLDRADRARREPVQDDRRARRARRRAPARRTGPVMRSSLTFDVRRDVDATTSATSPIDPAAHLCSPRTIEQVCEIVERGRARPA